MSNEPNYIKNRVENQINWYSKKATENKKRYHFSQIVIIIAAALIPIINVIDLATMEIRLFSSILGTIVIAITGIIQLKKYHENWIMYRSTEEALKKEKYTYENDAGAYSGLNDDERHRLLVEKIESIISNQNVIFFVTHRAGPDTSGSS